MHDGWSHGSENVSRGKICMKDDHMVVSNVSHSKICMQDDHWLWAMCHMVRYA